MKKFLLRALPVLALVAIGVTASLVGGASPAYAVTCTVDISGTGSSYSGPSGTVLSMTIANCGGGGPVYRWYRDGTQITGATGTQYTTTSSDTGHGITASYDCPICGGPTYSTEGFIATGSCKQDTASNCLNEEFNGANGTEPSSTVWDIHKQGALATDHINYRSSSSDPPGTPLAWNIEEDGNGELLVRASYCASSCGTDPNGSRYSGWLISKNQYSGTRVLEARVKLPCTTQTGFAALVGSENNPAFTGATKNYESELAEWPTGGSADDAIGMGADHWFNQNSADRQWAAGNTYPLGAGNNICGTYHTLTEVVNGFSAYWEFDGVLDTANPGPGSNGHPNYFWDGCSWPETKLAANASAGATTITVDSTSGFVAGQSLNVNTTGTSDQPGGSYPTISSINSGTNQITFSPGLASSHTAGATTTLSAASSAGASSVSVTSASDLYAGEAVTLDTGTAQESKTISTVAGTTVTFTSALAYAHSSGASVSANTVGGLPVHPDGSSCSSTYTYQGGVVQSATGTTNNLGYASGENMANKSVYLMFRMENLRSLGDPTGTTDVPLYVDWVHVWNN